MSDVSTQVAERLAQFRADVAGKAASDEQAIEAENARIAKLQAAKDVCIEACGPVLAHLETTTDPDEIALLRVMEAEAHAPHAAMLEAAYMEANGQRPGETNPGIAIPGVVTPLQSDLVVTSGVTA